MNSIEALGFEKLDPAEIVGGHTVADSAKIFSDVLNGQGTPAQNNVVLCNAALAIRTIKPKASFADCFYDAEAALMGKKALNSFERLINNN
jgi:anthranilate phosphoribosyltransferase